jgi:uncharacterized protein
VADFVVMYICFKFKKMSITEFEEEQESLVGREFEQQEMLGYLKSRKSELLSITGRRRVGKTFLIKRVYADHLVFRLTGLEDGERSAQLENFTIARNKFFPAGRFYAEPKNWMQAFTQLQELLERNRKQKRVIFFDELPWLAENARDFLPAFDNFWNSWAVDNKLIVVICGSAASWMITNVLNHKGGLHNRVTKKIHLLPLSLYETEQYLLAQGIKMPRTSLLRLYMATGGIPYYLDAIEKGSTHVMAIDKMFFGSKAKLKGEFDNLYKALFKNHTKHVSVIRALANKWQGLTRAELTEITNLPSGGEFTDVLIELETSGFITKTFPFGKQERQTLYRLTDEYSLFYLHFVEANQKVKNYWLKKSSTQEVKIWQGYAFENMCLKHIDAIKEELGISGILTSESSFYLRKEKDTPGCQIDLLIDRADQAVNICEMKFYDGPLSLTEDEIRKLKIRRNIFQEKTKTKKQLFLTLITADGLTDNINNMHIDKHITADVLFTLKTL